MKNTKYIPIISLKNMNYEYGISDEGWVIKDNGELILVKFQDDNLVPFLKILENTEELIDKLKIKVEETKQDVNDIFPIIRLIKMIIEGDLMYWLNLCVDFLMKMGCINEELLSLLGPLINEKDIPQFTRHKIKKFIFLING